MSKRGCSTCIFRHHYDCAPEEPECCEKNDYPFYQALLKKEEPIDLQEVKREKAREKLIGQLKRSGLLEASDGTESE